MTMESQPCETQAQRAVDMGGQTSAACMACMARLTNWGRKGLQCLSTALQGLLDVMLPLG